MKSVSEFSKMRHVRLSYLKEGDLWESCYRWAFAFEIFYFVCYFYQIGEYSSRRKEAKGRGWY